VVPDRRLTHPGEALLRRRAALARLAALGLPSVPWHQAAQARAFPSGPVTLLVPFAGGSPPDVYSRLVAEKLAKRLGQPVIVELRPGASSTIGTAMAARARPDGQTLLYATNSSLTAAPGLFKKLSYDPAKDFSAITVMLESYFCILVRAEDAGLSVQGLADRIRKDPARHAMGGGSTTAEVANRLFQNAAHLDHAYARYNSNQLTTDLLGGTLNAAWSPVSGALALARTGKAHILAITGPQRLPQLPDTPTLNEIYPGVVVDSWSGFFVPSATPRPVVAELYQHVAAVLADPDLVQKGKQDGYRPLTQTPEQSDAYVRKDFPRWRQLLQAAGIEPA
jgi:tripartite-type tricarboxylate transporter receptor subunit TctC